MNKYSNTKIEFHILQSFPVSCLNRDDVGSPKSAMIGGVQRARVSSQCWKRQIRLALHDLGIEIAVRTKKVEDLLKGSLLNAGATEEQASNCADVLKNCLSSDTLVFLSQREIDCLANYAKEHDFKLKASGDGEKKKPAISTTELEKLIKKPANKGLDGLDIALFGRMIAISKDMSVEAAASFSHAISTHEVSTDIDYFTALDDLAGDDQGAAHIGTNEFNSATYYRYVCLDVGELAQNLGLENVEEDKDTIKQAVEAFIKALVIAVPSAKQKTMSASSTWDYAKVLVREGQPLQLNFEEPVRAKGCGYLKPSIDKLKELISTKQSKLGSLYSNKKELEWGVKDDYSVDQLIKDTMDAI